MRRTCRRRSPAWSRAGALSRDQRLRRRTEDAIRDLGFDLVVTLSLTDPAFATRLRLPGDDPRTGPIAITNPLSREHSVLRTTLLAGLLDVARYNRAHGAERVAVAESGRAYLRAGERLPGSLGGRSRASGPRPRTSRGGSRRWRPASGPAAGVTSPAKPTSTP